MPSKGVAKARGRVLYFVYDYRTSPGHYKQNQLQADRKKSKRLNLGIFEKL